MFLDSVLPYHNYHQLSFVIVIEIERNILRSIRRIENKGHTLKLLDRLSPKTPFHLLHPARTFGGRRIVLPMENSTSRHLWTLENMSGHQGKLWLLPRELSRV